MRTSPVLHERHLIEAVRQQVITHDQMEGILAIARSAARTENVVAPDVRWIGYLQGAVVCIAAFLVATWNNNHVWSIDPVELIARSLGATAFFGALGLFLRRFRWAEVPASLLLTGAAMQTWGVGAGLCKLIRYPAVSDWDGLSNGFMDGVRLGGFATVALVSLLLWRWKRVGPALGMTGLSTLVALQFATALWLRPSLGLGSMEEAALFGFGGVVLLALTLLRDRLWRSGPDGGFWLSLVGLGALGICAVERIDRAPGEVALFLPLSLLVGGFGFRARRTVWLWAAGAAVIAFPSFAAHEAHLGDAAVVATLILGALFVAVAAHKLRRHMLTSWIDDAHAADEDRSLWT